VRDKKVKGDVIHNIYKNRQALHSASWTTYTLRQAAICSSIA